MGEKQGVKYFTYQNLCRLNYVNAGGWLAAMVLDTATFSKNLGVDAELWDSSSTMKAMLDGYRAMCFTYIASAAAMAQCSSEGFQRKYLLANMSILPAVLVQMFAMQDVITPFALQLNAGLTLSILAAHLYCLFVCHKSPSSDPKWSGNNRLTYFHGYVAFSWLAWGTIGFADPGMVWGHFGGKLASDEEMYVAKVFGILLVGLGLNGLTVMRYAPAEDQKKVTQYAIVATLAWVAELAHSKAAMADQAGRWDAAASHFGMLNLNLFLAVYAAYPAGWKKWMFRIDYLLFGSSLVVLLINPDVCWHLWEMSKHSAEETSWITMFIIAVCLASIGASQSDDASQRKFLQYGLVARVFNIYQGLTGKVNYGSELYLGMFILFLNLLVLYPPKTEAFNFFRDSGKKSGSTSPMKSTSPKRSMMKKRN